MIKRLLILVPLLICGSASILSAQQTPRPSPTPRPTLPPGPPLNKAAEFAQWTITSRTVPDTVPSPSPSASPDAGQPAASATLGKKAAAPVDQQTTVTKTRTIRYEQTVATGGAQLQKWCVPDMQVMLRGSSNPVVVFPGGGSADSPYTDYSKTDFGGFEWISKRNFTGIEKVMGQDCLVFRDKLKLEADNMRAGPPPSAVACINAETRLPVALQLGEEARTYQFNPAPTEMLSLPPNVDALIKQWRKTLHQASLPAAKP